jgi:hypothetical protein
LRQGLEHQRLHCCDVGDFLKGLHVGLALIQRCFLR